MRARQLLDSGFQAAGEEKVKKGKRQKGSQTVAPGDGRVMVLSDTGTKQRQLFSTSEF